MIIRQATAADTEQVVLLWQALLDYYHKKVDVAVLRRSFRYAAAHPEQVRVYLALDQGKALGTASLHLGHYSTWYDSWYGHVEDVVVYPEARRRGVARALIIHIIGEARQAGLSRIELNALADNSAAHRLYRGLGFSTDSVAYELHFTGAEGSGNSR